MTATARPHFWDNPLLVRERARWRSRWRPVLAITLLATLLACAYSVVIWGLVSATLARELPELVVVPQLATSTLLLFAGLGWFVTLLVLPAIAAGSVSRERTSGVWDLLRLTNVGSRAIVDGHIVRTLLHFPLWLLLIPTLPLQITSYAGSAGAAALSEPGGLPDWPALLAVLGVYGLAQLLAPLAQLLACVAIGVAAGSASRSRNGALGATFAALFVLELVVPGAFSACAAFVGILAIPLMGESGDTSQLLLALLGAGAAGVAAQLLYQLAVFGVARAYAHRQIERGYDG